MTSADIERAAHALRKAIVRGLISPDFSRLLRKRGVRANSTTAALRLATLHGLVDELLDEWRLAEGFHLNTET